MRGGDGVGGWNRSKREFQGRHTGLECDFTWEAKGRDTSMKTDTLTLGDKENDGAVYGKSFCYFKVGLTPPLTRCKQLLICSGLFFFFFSMGLKPRALLLLCILPLSHIPRPWLFETGS
jgi:hypothetical protein